MARCRHCSPAAANGRPTIVTLLRQNQRGRAGAKPPRDVPVPPLLISCSHQASRNQQRIPVRLRQRGAGRRSPLLGSTAKVGRTEATDPPLPCRCAELTGAHQSLL